MTEMYDAPEVTVDVVDLELTGHQQIDEALDRLQGLGDLDITAHPAQYDAIHGVLRESLANAGRDEVELETP